MKIPYYDLKRVNDSISGEIEDRIHCVIDDCDFVLGKQVKEFEKRFAGYIGVKHCIGVDNGLDALHIILEALNLPKDSEVLVPANTFIATALAVTYAGLKLVLVEPDEKNMLIDPDRIVEKITDKTKVIMPVHLYGRSCNMEKIMSIAAKYNLYVVEDNAQAQGCVYQGKKTGSFGIASATSFYPGKNIGAFGDAGAITTDDDRLALRVRALINYGSIEKYHHEYKGFNARLDEIQAAVLNAKLPYLDGWNRDRKRAVAYYFDNIKNPFVRLPEKTEESVWHVFPVRVHPEERERFIGYLKDNDIMASIHYPIAVADQRAYQDDFEKGEYPVAAGIAAQEVSLPIYPMMETAELKHICDVINKWE